METASDLRKNPVQCSSGQQYLLPPWRYSTGFHDALVPYPTFQRNGDRERSDGFSINSIQTISIYSLSLQSTASIVDGFSHKRTQQEATKQNRRRHPSRPHLPKLSRSISEQYFKRSLCCGTERFHKRKTTRLLDLWASSFEYSRFQNWKHPALYQSTGLSFSPRK